MKSCTHHDFHRLVNLQLSHKSLEIAVLVVAAASPLLLDFFILFLFSATFLSSNELKRFHWYVVYIHELKSPSDNLLIYFQSNHIGLLIRIMLYLAKIENKICIIF